ncbi:50S ribosomal protein L28 [Thermotalea metallivorans]|uniref:Large ribosomal subunit protein bL28 n=1 Tax=Thermotalea metallivorans TaxID=520762 RepID=A0A140L619_9FIRM|nr:50S ribosomal protein L28 [Thermotalea metallivorans]KXG75994.1 50S ribosomal protein L28 [Thermotalea metallivorans]
MSRACDVCGKGRISGNSVSHSNRHTRRVWNANIKKVKTMVNGSPARINVCTRCLRSNKVERAI